MTSYYSDLYTPMVGETGHAITKFPTPTLSPAGPGASRLYFANPRITIPASTIVASGEKLYVCTMKSGDRLRSLTLSQDANWGATTTFNVGLYKTGGNNDGAVIDADLFAAADDWKDALTREDILKQATTLIDLDRGKTLWQMVAKGGAVAYTADPKELWDIVCTATQLLDVVAGAVEMSWEVEYKASR
jgi:hypothetical protein